jgi:proton glutamate symport protein
MTLTTRVLLGLGLGLAAGAAAAATRHPLLLGLLPIVEPVGTLWLNGLRMTVVPLIVALLVAGVGTMSDAASAGRTGARALALMAGFLATAGLLAALLTPALLAWLPVTPVAPPETTSSYAAPSLGEWFTALVPANPIQAAAEGAVLPLVVFALLFGLATASLPAEPRERLLGFFRALADAMMVIVRWVLNLAPIGVFALVFPVGAGAGLGVVGALGTYVLIVSALCALITLLIYPVTTLAAGIPLRRFAAAAAPAQAVAFSTRSSLAAMPAMIESAQSRLGLPHATTSLVLPLAVALMRVTSPLAIMVSAIFAAAFYAIPLTAGQIAAGAAIAVVTSLGSVGLPGQVSLVAVRIPVFAVMGVPLEVLGLLLAVDVIPDTFRTVGNVTAHLSVTAIVARTAGQPQPAAVAPAPADAGAEADVLSRV